MILMNKISNWDEVDVLLKEDKALHATKKIMDITGASLNKSSELADERREKLGLKIDATSVRQSLLNIDNKLSSLTMEDRDLMCQIEMSWDSDVFGDLLRINLALKSSGESTTPTRNYHLVNVRPIQTDNVYRDGKTYHPLLFHLYKQITLELAEQLDVCVKLATEHVTE